MASLSVTFLCSSRDADQLVQKTNKKAKNPLFSIVYGQLLTHLVFRKMSSVKRKGDPKYYEAGGKPFPKEEVEFILIGAGASLTFKFA